MLGHVPHHFLYFMSTIPGTRVASTAYEHANGIYGGRLENRKVLDPKEILRIPSAKDVMVPQFRIWSAEPSGPLRWIQHIRMPDEPYIQGRAIESAVRPEKGR